MEIPGIGFTRIPFSDFIVDAMRQGAMSHGEWKRRFFAGLRALVGVTGATATVFVTDAWAAKMTKEGEKHRDEREKAIDTGFETLVKRGWATRASVIQACDQTEAHVCLLQHKYRRAAGNFRIARNNRSKSACALIQRKRLNSQAVWPVIFGITGLICARAPKLNIRLEFGAARASRITQ
jgi:hypothetical protein